MKNPADDKSLQGMGGVVGVTVPGPKPKSAEQVLELPCPAGDSGGPSQSWALG